MGPIGFGDLALCVVMAPVALLTICGIYTDLREAFWPTSTTKNRESTRHVP